MMFLTKLLVFIGDDAKEISLQEQLHIKYSRLLDFIWEVKR